MRNPAMDGDDGKRGVREDSKNCAIEIERCSASTFPGLKREL
jgi:hypothetical protein